MAQAPKAITHARPRSKDDKGDGKGKGATVTFPSAFGSHASMVNEELAGKIAADKQDAADPWTILADERGPYATRRSRLDTGMADPARCADQPVRDAQLAALTGAEK